MISLCSANIVEFIFDLLPGNEPPYEYAPGHVTIKTDSGTGTSKPNHYFMLAISLTDFLSSMKVFIEHGKMSGCHWSVIDSGFSVDFERVTRRLKCLPKPIRIVCGDTDLGAVAEEELARAILEGVPRFLREYAGKLGEDEFDLAAVTEEFDAAFY